MALTLVEGVAGIFALLAVVKMIVVLFNKKAWYEKVNKPIFNNAKSASMFFGVLAVLVFFLLIQEMTVTQIFAGVAFGAILMAFALMKYYKILMPNFNKIVNMEMNSWLVIYILVWLVLSLWVLMEIFG